MSSADYLKKRQELEANRPDAYKSQFSGNINALMSQITDRKPFSYDFNADPLYQQYKDQYTKLGAEANMNAVANASAMTGGFGNSYAVTAGSQANQQYLTQLNEVIPRLYAAAQSRYDSDTDNLYKQYNMMQDADSADYQKYQNSLADYNNQLNYYTNAYNSALQAEQNQRDHDEKVRQFNEQMALQSKQYEESIRQFNEQMALQREKLNGSSSGGSSSGGSSGDSSRNDSERETKSTPTTTTSTKKNDSPIGNITYAPTSYSGFVGNTNAQVEAMKKAGERVISTIQTAADGIAKNSHGNVQAVYNYVDSKVKSGQISAEVGATILNKALK